MANMIPSRFSDENAAETIADTFDTLMSLYVGQWLQFLAYGPVEAQEASMYALRSHGVEVWGQGYYEDFRWTVTHAGKSVVIDPEHKDRPPQWMSGAPPDSTTQGQ